MHKGVNPCRQRAWLSREGIRVAPRCVYWYGDVTKEDLQAAVRMVKPGDSSESITYVNRVLAFIFATDDARNRRLARDATYV